MTNNGIVEHWVGVVDVGKLPEGYIRNVPLPRVYETRALSSQECPMYIRYLITTRIHMEFPCMKIHVE
jgi:hypothetical protein